MVLSAAETASWRVRAGAAALSLSYAIVGLGEIGPGPVGKADSH